jgi:hypothetical protein
MEPTPPKIAINRRMHVASQSVVYNVARALVQYLLRGDDRVALLWADANFIRRAEEQVDEVFRSTHYKWTKRRKTPAQWGITWTLLDNRSTLIVLAARRARVAVCGTYHEIDPENPLRRPRYVQSKKRGGNPWLVGWQRRRDAAELIEDPSRRRRRLSDLQRERRLRNSRNKAQRERIARGRADLAREINQGRRRALAGSSKAVKFDISWYNREIASRLAERGSRQEAPPVSLVGEGESDSQPSCGVGLVTRSVS